MIELWLGLLLSYITNIPLSPFSLSLSDSGRQSERQREREREREERERRDREREGHGVSHQMQWNEKHDSISYSHIDTH